MRLLNSVSLAALLVMPAAAAAQGGPVSDAARMMAKDYA